MIYVVLGLLAGLGVVAWRLRLSEARHRRIVEGTGVALWEEDLSELVESLRAIPATTVQDCRAWLEAHPEFVQSCIAKIRVLGVNDAAVRMYGARSREELFDNLDRLFLPESLAVFKDELVAFWEGRTTYEAEVPSLTVDGRRRVLYYAIRVPFPDRGYRYVLISVVDVTPLKAAEAALRESEERYRTLFDNAPIGIGVADAGGTLLAVNDTLLALGGFDRRDGLPNVAELYYDAGTRDALLAEVRAVGVVRQREVRFRHKDGSPWEAMLSLARITLNGRPCVLAIVEDIEQRKRLEEALQQARKMEAVGQLTGGIAHDFNNFLTAIQVNAELATEAVTRDPDEVRRALAAIERTAERSAAMVRNLLAFSRREGLRLEPVELCPIVEEAATLLTRLLPEAITVSVRSAAELRGATTRGDRSAVEQMLVNLATNARDAMPTGGALTLTLGAETTTEARPVVGGKLPPGRWLTIQAHDTGEGMPTPLAERAFEPFFTTKPQGAGSGLGLAMVYGLMRQHNGAVQLDTVPGHGTTFTLYFPWTPTPASPSAPGDAAAETGRGETVLVVEDEVAIRDATRRLLERSGYRVLTAGDGTDGLVVLTSQDQYVRLVIADVVMPTMGGPQLLQAARASGRNVPFLFMSGYTERATHASQLDPDVPLLPKPWRAGDLLRMVRARIDGAS